jgi:hypothetical protein
VFVWLQYAALIAKRLAQWHAKMEIPDVAREPAWSLLVRKWLELIPKNDLSHVQREEQVVILMFPHVSQCPCWCGTNVVNDSSEGGVGCAGY